MSFIVQLLSTAFYVVLMPYYVMRHENDGIVPYVVGVLFSFGQATAFGLLLAAIFTGRTPGIRQ